MAKKVKTKVKTKKILTKKIKVTAGGKIMRSHQLRSGHLRRHKSKQALRRHKQPIEMNKTLTKTLSKLLGLK